MNKIIKTIVIYLLILLIILIICTEYDRRTYKTRRELQNIGKYFSDLNKVLFSPISCFVKMNSKVQQLVSYPDLEYNFPNYKILEDNWKIIKDEALNMIDKGKATTIQGDMFFKDKITSDGKWKKYYIKWYNPISKEVEYNCPNTTKLINSIPEIKIAMFSILEPGAYIKPHYGPFKSCLRYHLGLDTPEENNCFISVNEEKYSWKNGESVLFDDTFEHYVRNNTNKRRIILFCDIQRKLNTDFANKINNIIVDYIAPITTRSNDKKEKVDKIK
jgi:beta-hydroxylase